MKKFILLLLTLLVAVLSLCVHPVSAEVQTLGTFRQNYDVNLKQISGNSTYCNITSVNSPSFADIIEDVQMQKVGNEYNYTLTNTSEIGQYTVNGFCDEDGDTVVWSYDFLVTPNGRTLTTSQGIVYIIVFGLSAFIFLLCLYFFVVCPWRNPRDSGNYIMQVTYYKYLKYVLFIISYLLFLFTVYMAETLTGNFLYLHYPTKIFNFIFWFAFVFLFPIFLLTAIAVIFHIVQDKKIWETLNRGLSIR